MIFIVSGVYYRRFGKYNEHSGADTSGHGSRADKQTTEMVGGGRCVCHDGIRTLCYIQTFGKLCLTKIIKEESFIIFVNLKL